jgi:16S rRNA (guanine(966)-N(2))-methyltransferase RsmD
MRVIAGTFRSRSLQAPPGLATRPTSDRLRETLFNVLSPRIEGARFLDLYAGSGAVGIEAISRGAVHVTFVERAPAALKVLRDNLARLGVRQVEIAQSSVAAFVRKAPVPAQGFDLVFLDPPYDAVDEYSATLSAMGGAASARLAPGSMVIAEHRRKEQLADAYEALRRTRLLEQGDAALSFYAVADVNREMDGDS